MDKFFNIRYEFDKQAVFDAISERLGREGSDYICVADGVVLDNANRRKDYLDVINGGMFSVCDSSYVPLYIRWLYGKRVKQYCGHEFFTDVVLSRRYRMIFLGGEQRVLDGLKTELTKVNEACADMVYHELPFCKVDEFDYPAIARMIEDDGAEIVWVALGAPKQEMFMARLKPHLSHGVMIAVGAVFKFASGVDVSRAPKWMVKSHLEFVHRISKEPKKQIRRCGSIVSSLPKLLFKEWKRKRRKKR